MSDEYTAKYANIPNITPGLMDALLGEYNMLKPWLTGEQPKHITPENMHEWAADLAMGLTFAGPKAKTADLGKLKQAQQLAANGMDNEAIRQATDWFQGMDGKWRFEIDDSGMKYKPGAAWDKESAPFREAAESFGDAWRLHDLAKENGTSLGHVRDIFSKEYGREPSSMAMYYARNSDPEELAKWVDEYARKSSDMRNNLDSKVSTAMDHDQLFNAYPDLAGAKFEIKGGTEFNGGGHYDPSIDAVRVHPDSAYALKSGRNIALHELQHAIQEREGFARGGSPSEFANVSYADLVHRSNKAQDAYIRAKENGGIDPESGRRISDIERGINEYSEAIRSWKDPHQSYLDLAGEIEARDVSARMNMTPEQRRATPPAFQKDAIVRFGKGDQAGGLMESLASQAQDPSNTLVAHIMPEEADALKRKNGGGSINPITGLPEFWSDGGGDEDGDSIGGGRRGGNEGFSDTERGSSWGGGDGGGWGGGWGDSGDSVGSYSDGLSNVDATRAREAMADMQSAPQDLAGVVNRSAMGDIFSDDQRRQDRVKDMWGGATKAKEYPGMSWGERAFNTAFRADKVAGYGLGLIGSLLGSAFGGIPGSLVGGRLGDALGRKLGANLTPAATVANLDRTKSMVGAGYPGMGGIALDKDSIRGFGSRLGGGMAAQGYAGGADRDMRGESTSIDPWKQDAEAEQKRKDEEEKKKKREEEQKTILNRILGLDDEATNEQKPVWAWNPVNGWQELPSG